MAIPIILRLLKIIRMIIIIIIELKSPLLRLVFSLLVGRQLLHAEETSLIELQEQGLVNLHLGLGFRVQGSGSRA